MVVIGSGPAGQRAAVQAAKLGKRVAVVERLPEIGGVTVNTGTASKTLREAVLHLTGYRERNVYGESYSVKQNITMSYLMVRTRYVMQQQVLILRSQLGRNNPNPPPKPNPTSDSVANSDLNTGNYLSPQQVKGRVVENDQFSYETQPHHQLGGGSGNKVEMITAEGSIVTP